MANGSSKDPRIGALLRDKWRVEKRLGRGGVATVYAAVHRNGNRVAIKMLNAEFARHPEVKKRFLREGYAANAVNHPGVVRVLDDDVSEDGVPFLVMDLLEGEMLDARRIRMGGRVPIAEVLAIASQLLDVLAAAHEKAIIHRDIKPENIFIEHDGTLKVLDFGVARMRDAAQENTATGMLLGTPEFMSPEQANGIQGDVDAKTDLWATGATLFTLLSGEPVHDCTTTAAQILATVTRPARSLGSVTGDVPPKIVSVIDRALAFEKHRRWPDARSMKEALDTAAKLAGIAARSPAPKPGASSSPKPASVQIVPAANGPSHGARPITGDEPTIVTDEWPMPSDGLIASSDPTREQPPPVDPNLDEGPTVTVTNLAIAREEEPVALISGSHLVADDDDAQTDIVPARGPAATIPEVPPPSSGLSIQVTLDRTPASLYPPRQNTPPPASAPTSGGAAARSAAPTAQSGGLPPSTPPSSAPPISAPALSGPRTAAPPHGATPAALPSTFAATLVPAVRTVAVAPLAQAAPQKRTPIVLATIGVLVLWVTVAIAVRSCIFGEPADEPTQPAPR